MIMIFLVLLVAVNSLISVFEYNPIDKLSDFVNNLFNSNIPINKTIYVLAGLSALMLAKRMDTWLPFLGKSVFPSSFVPLKENNGDEKVKIKTTPNSKIAYWASNPNKNPNVPVVEAYDDYMNSGVVMSDKDGNAELVITKNTGYVVPSGKKINRHLHYRVLGNEYGMMSKIKTVYL
jgi:uncharacterized membrane protein YuzA (DUF378 family)